MSTTSASSPIFKQNRQQSSKLKSGEVLERLHLKNSLDAVAARATVRKLAGSLGFGLVDQIRIATAIFEIGYNIVSCTGEGIIIIYWREEDERAGLEFFCHGGSLNTSELATVLQTDGNASYSKLILIGLKKLADQFELVKDPKYGNCFRAVIWKK